MTNTAVILSGGKSRRFGRPKGLEEVDGRTLIARLADEARAAGITSIYLSTDDPESFDSLGLQTIPDRFRGCGPLAGIHSALIETAADSLLVLACDLPAITSNELSTLLQAASRDPAPVVYSVTPSQEHPLCSVVSRKLLEPLTLALTEGRYGVLRFLKSVDHRTVPFSDERPFLNMNVPDDLTALEGVDAC